MSVRREPAERRPARGEALWWFLFVQGGVVAALLAPIHIFVQGVLAPLGVPVVTHRYQTFVNALGNPLIRLYLFVLISLPLFHFAHRGRTLVEHLGLHAGGRIRAFLFYGGAVLGTVITAYVLITA